MSIHSSTPQTAAHLLTALRQPAPFSSGSSQLDALLTRASPPDAPAGIKQAQTLELYGPPGIGKTRTLLGFLMQTRFRALDAEEDEELDWTEDEVLVADCQGSLGPELIHSTAESYCAYKGVHQSEAVRASQGVHYRRITDQSHLTAFLHSLPDWHREHGQVKLVLIDNLSAYIRQTAMQIPTRTMLFNLAKSTFAQLRTAGVTVIATSQVQTKMVAANGEPAAFGQAGGEGVMVSQLAEVFRENCWRVALYYDEDGERMAHLVSSPAPARSTDAAFAMDVLGPCDRPELPANS